ncbi:MAG: hypothetical protein AAGC68_06255 [Verrucomicrobiota bacterium]
MSRTHFMRFHPGLLAIVLSGGWLVGLSDEKPDDQPSSSREQWEKLEPKDQEKLREALRSVWTDPDVTAAREGVRRASEAYQEAIRSAIGKTDPSVAGLVQRMQQDNEGKMRARVGGGPGGKYAYRRINEYPMGPPGFLESLSEEERVKLEAAEEKVQESPKVQEARKALEGIRKQDEALRVRRMEAHRRMRLSMLEEILQEDPSLKPVIERLAALRDGPQSGMGGGKGQRSKGKKAGGSQGGEERTKPEAP